MSVTYSNDGDKAVMVMRCDCDSHPFQDRRIVLEDQIKVGRSVARVRPSPTNAIFDCKVLSRNHALIWYKDGRFWLRDTNSSNGTFVNNTRVTKRVDEEHAERELFSGEIIRFGVDVVENDTTHGSIITQITLYHPNGDEARPKDKHIDISQRMFSSESYHSEQLFLLTNSINKALVHEQILEAKLDSMKTLLDETQKISEEGWQAMLNEEHLLEKLSVYEAQLSLLKQNPSEETLQSLVTELQERNYNLKSASDVTLERAISGRMEALMKAKELETCLSNSERDCARLREECESTKEAYQSITVNLEMKVTELEHLEKQLKEVVEEKHRLESQLSERSEDLQAMKEKLAAALYGQVPLKSSAVNSDVNSKQTVAVMNGLNHGEAIEPAEQLGDIVEMTGQLQTSLSHRADEVREELALAELNELDRFCDIQERLANSESNLEHMLDAAYQDISSNISSRSDLLSNQHYSVQLIKALQDELEVLSNLTASIPNGPTSSGLDPIAEEDQQTTSVVESNDDCFVSTTTSISREVDAMDRFSAALDRAKKLAVLVKASQGPSSDPASSLSTNAMLSMPSVPHPQTSGDVVASLVSTQSSSPSDDAPGGWEPRKAEPGQQHRQLVVETVSAGSASLSDQEEEHRQSTSAADASSLDDEVARLRAELLVSSGETDMYKQLAEKWKCQDEAKSELLLSVREECDALRRRINQIESEVAATRANHQRLALEAKRSQAEAEELRASRDELAAQLSEARLEQVAQAGADVKVTVVPDRGLATASPDRSAVNPSPSSADGAVQRSENAVLAGNSARATPDSCAVRSSQQGSAATVLSLFTVIPVMVLLCALMAYILSKFKP